MTMVSSPVPIAPVRIEQPGTLASANHPDVEHVFHVLNNQARRVQRFYDYYNGENGKVYMSPNMRRMFDKINVDVSENWIEVAVDAVVDRLNMKTVKFEGAAEEFNVAFEEDWTEFLSNVTDDVMENTAIAGHAYLIIWPTVDEDGEETGEVDVFCNDARTACVIRDPRNPRKKLMGAKWWMEDKRRHITIYYPDRIVTWRSVEEEKDGIALLQVPLFEMSEEAENPYGIIPVFQFARRENLRSDLVSLIKVQDATSLSLMNTYAALEYTAFRPKVVISAADIQDGQLQFGAAGKAITIPAGTQGEQPTQIYELSAADIGPFLTALDRAASAMSALSRVPRHYYSNTGQVPSGKALTALELPLGKKVKKYIDRMLPEWRSAFAFYALIKGLEIDTIDIAPEFDSPVELDTYDVEVERNLKVATEVAAQVPITYIWKAAGYTDDQIEEMKKSREADNEERLKMMQADTLMGAEASMMVADKQAEHSKAQMQLSAKQQEKMMMKSAELSAAQQAEQAAQQGAQKKAKK